MKVVLSPTARRKLENLLEYQQEEWSEKVKLEFMSKLDNSIDQISTHPKSCPESQRFKGLHNV
jgi:plasmid stabilization system protein ParE